MSNTIPSFNINKFLTQLRDPDIDFTIIAFNDLIKYLNTVKDFDLKPDVIQNEFLPNVITRLSDKIPTVVSPIFRIIVLLSEKLPIGSLASFFDQIFNFVNDPECEIRNQILSVLREVLTNSISYPTDRQKEIVNFFINKLNENGDIEILIFNIDIMASLLECLGELFDENNLKHAKELITAHIEDPRPEILPSIASLARIWMVVAVIFIPEQFCSMIQQLYDIGQNNSNAFTILSSIVCYRPSIYKDEAVNLISLFFERIQIEEEDLAKKLDEDPETDIYYDTPYVSHITDYISSLTALVKTFPEKCTVEMVETCISIAFQYLTYGITPSVDEADENNANEEEDEFVIEGGEPGEVIELDEADDEIITGDDSWKIRKTAIALSIALIQCFTDKFFESLGFRDEESDCLGVVNTLIKDSDSGSQKDAFDFLKVVIHYYYDRLEEVDVNQWFSTLRLQLTSKNNQSIASTIIETIAYVLNEYKIITEELLIKIIFAIQPLLNNNTIQSALSFILIIFNVVEPTVHILSSLASTLTGVINEKTISSNIPYIPTTSKLFVYARATESLITEDKECIENLRNLTTSIISLCTVSEDENAEKNTQAFETLGVFVASFDNDIFDLFDECLNILVESFENNESLKQICCSISLIAASPYGSNKLCNYADRIRCKLCDLLSQDITHIDNAYLFRYLWALRILLQQKIIRPDSKDCEKVAPYLAEIFSTPDTRNIILSTMIFMNMNNAAFNSLDKLKESLENQVLNDQIIKGYAKLVALCASIDISNTEKFVVSLIQEEYSKENSEITPNVAYVVGYVAAQSEVIRKKLLEDFEEKINGEDENNIQFALQCIGEIGSIIDLSDKDSLVNKVFDLIRNQNREVFNAAAICIGLISVGSKNKILPRVLVEAMKETDSSVWILAIYSMTKRLSKVDRNQSKLEGNEFETISKFLVKNADYSKPTEKSIADSFCYMFKINPQTYVKQLIDICKSKELAGPVAAHGIALYFEEVATSEDPYFCFNFIDDVMNSINLKNPRVSEYGILCLKLCLQLLQQYQNQENSLSNTSKLSITQSSEKVIKEFDPFKYYNVVCEATKFDHETQIVVIETLGNTIEEDIGSSLRLNAINCLTLIISLFDESIDAGSLFNIATGVIRDDINDEVKSQALVLLTKLALNSKVTSELYEIILRSKNVFTEIDEIVYPPSRPKIDALEENFLRLIVALKTTECKKIKEIEEIYSSHKDDPKIKKYESDLSYSVNSPSPFAGILSSGSAGVSLMKIFYPEASIIFLI